MYLSAHHLPVKNYIHLPVENFHYTKQPAKPIDNLSTRFKLFWDYAFRISGLDVSNDGKSAAKQSIIFYLFVLSQLAFLLHYSGCFLHTLALGATLTRISYYNGLLVSIALTLLSLRMMSKKRVAIAKMFDESVSSLSDNPKPMKTLWWYSLIPFLCLFFMAVIETSLTVYEIVAKDDAGFRYYSELYLLRIYIPDEYLLMARVALGVELSIAFLFSMGFVNISVWFFNRMCHLLFHRFKQLNENAEKVLLSGIQLRSSELSEYRKQHQLACEMAEQLSDVWSPLLFFWLFGFILTICFDLKAIYTGLSLFGLCVFMTDILRLSWLLVGLYHAGTFVHVEAHRFAEMFITYPVPKSGLDLLEKRKYYADYMLLSERLTNQRVGIYASGLFVLNAGSFLTMSGTVLTYAIVLYQS